jgi:hypothetical protein
LSTTSRAWPATRRSPVDNATTALRQSEATWGYSDALCPQISLVAVLGSAPHGAIAPRQTGTPIARRTRGLESKSTTRSSAYRPDSVGLKPGRYAAEKDVEAPPGGTRIRNCPAGPLPKRINRRTLTCTPVETLVSERTGTPVHKSNPQREERATTKSRTFPSLRFSDA